MKKEKIIIPEGGLLQSKYWAEVLQAEGEDTWQFKNDNKQVYCINYKLPLIGKYTYCPRAYNLINYDIEQLVQQAKTEKMAWLRLDIKDENLIKILKKKYTIHKAPHNMQPRQNLIINIDLPEDELLAKMKSKTRYNIRLAKKRGVKILVTREQKYIDKFITLVEQTAQRKGVSFHQREHYLQILKNIPDDILQLYVAEYQDEVIAVNIISFYGGAATYLHGATSDKYRNMMAPFLLQWQAILDAKKRGLKYYDFGGVEVFGELELKPIADKLQGVTKFKLGFSPETKPFQTIGSYDIIINKWKYWLYQLVQGIKGLF